jgi:hypothetical protein
VLLLALVVIPWIAWTEVIRRHHLAFLPPELGVTSRMAAYEVAWGWGPGANESGLIIYRMPEALAAALEDGRVPATGGEPWMPTPFAPGGPSDPNDAKGGCEGDACAQIEQFLGPYGIFLKLPQDVEEMVDQALTQPGSWVRSARFGVVLLIPGEKRVVYAYAG